MVAPNKLQTSIGVRRNAEPMGLSIIIDHSENHNITTRNRNDRPRSSLRPAPVITSQVYYDRE